MSNHINAQEKREYSIINRKEESEDVVTLLLSPVGFTRPSFVSGQFVTVYLPELGVVEGKAYSVSSPPDEEGFAITVKDIGAFSHALCIKKAGDTIVASGPYGFFYSEESDTPLVLLAGGIGVTPFRSMILDILQKNPSRKMALHYSVPHYPDAVFLETFLPLKEKHANFSLMIHVTKGQADEVGTALGRITLDQVVSIHGCDASVEYLMCGSIPFVRDMWKGLRAHNVPEERLYTEAFFA